MNGPTLFDLFSVFSTVADAVPEYDMLVWRQRRLTYAEVERHVDVLAAYLRAAGLGCHTERAHLARHESGQDHLGIYLRNGTEYLEAMIAGYRARVAPFNVSYRYVEDELTFLLADANARALVYHAEFAPRVNAIRAHLPKLQMLIQVADDSGHDLLPGAVDYETIVTATQPITESVEPSGEDLYIIYTGGTTGMPKGVLWRQHDIFLAAMGGRPFGAGHRRRTHRHLPEPDRGLQDTQSVHPRPDDHPHPRRKGRLPMGGRSRRRADLGRPRSMGHRGRQRLSVITSTRYQLFVVVSDVGELVASAGGWICDRVQAGWDVSVAVTEPRDLRPLQILGVTTVVADQGFESISDRGEVAAIAFAGEAFDRDELLRRQVLKVLDQGVTEVNIWGKALPSRLEGRVHRLQHRLSVVSRAFKAHAVAAAPIPGADISATEDLYSSAPWYDASVDNLREDA